MNTSMLFRPDDINEVIIKVCQTMLFAECQFHERQFPSPPTQPGFRSQIEFTGELDGTLSLIATKEVCSEWAALMAGESNDELALDVLKELTNIIGGNLINRSSSGNGRVKLHPPTAEETGDFDFSRGYENAFRAYITVDSNPLVLAIKQRS